MADSNPDSKRTYERRRPPKGVDPQLQADGLLPIANVGRIMKHGLSTNAKVSKEAKETMQECASEFIGFVTGEAAERCRKEKRKTMNGDDIISALAELGLDDYVQPMKLYLSKYRDHEAARATAAGAGVGSVYPESGRDETMPMSLFGSSFGGEQFRDKASSSSSSSFKDAFTQCGRRT